MEETLRVPPDQWIQPPNASKFADGTDNADVDLLFPAVPGQRQVVWNVFWSYDAEPTGGSICAYSGGDQVTAVLPITGSGVGWLRMKIVGAINRNLLIRLAAGGQGAIGHLHVEQHWSRP